MIEPLRRGTKGCLPLCVSRERIALLEIFRRLGWGRIESLHVRNGEPFFDPAPRIIQTVVVSSAPIGQASLQLSELASRCAVKNFLAEMGRIESGLFLRIEVKACSPCFFEVEADCLGSGAEAYV